MAATIDPLNRAVSTLYDKASRPTATVNSLGQAVSTVYDPASRPVQTIDALGRTWISVYDSASRKVASIDPLLNRNTMVYDPNSRVIATLDPLGRITSSTYDASNRRTESINPLGECVTTLYDAANNAIASIDPLARCTTSGYDLNNRLIVTMDPLGNAVTTTFDAAGQAVARIDARGFAVTSVYDRNSRKVATIDPLGYVATTMYDVANQPIAQVDALSRIVTSVFDQAGRTIATVDALSFRVSTVYDPASQAIATVDALGYPTSSVYDLPNRKIATMDPLGHVVSTVFDAAGQAVASVNALGFVTTTAFDQAGRAVATINPLGQAVTSVYDPASQVVATVDANGNAVTSVYDQASRKIATVNALGYAVTNTYDQAGQRIVLTDANGNAVTFLFDQAGRDVGSIDPLSRRVTFGYDPNGNKTLKIDAVGNVSTMAYDADNRKVLEQFSNGTQHGYAWDPVGNRTLASDPTGVYTSTYSPRNQVLSVTNPDDKEIQYAYDARRSRVVMIDPDGGVFTNVYDPAMRLIVVVNPQAQATTLSYDAANREIQKQLANGAVTSQIYDNADRVVGLVNAIANGNLVGRYTHTYDNAAHKLTSLEANGDLTSWTYDKAYQLTQEQRSGNYVFNTNYQYDPAGNRTLRVEIDGQRATSTYDAANQISTVNDSLLGVTTFTHDNNGNRIEKNAAGIPTYYGWDPLNRMVTAEPVSGLVSLTYNADNKRVERATPTHAKKFIYDFEKVLQEVDANSLDPLQEFTWTDQQYGDLVSDYFPGPDQTRYHEFDAQGSTAALLDDDQATRAVWRYRAFGLAHPWLEGVNGSPADLASALGMNLATAALKSPYGYVGKQGYWYDREAELYYLGFNPPYDSATGTRLGKDSLYPQSGPNPYPYCRNDPVNNTDASGLEPLPPPYSYNDPRAGGFRDRFLNAFYGTSSDPDPSADEKVMVFDKPALKWKLATPLVTRLVNQATAHDRVIGDRRLARKYIRFGGRKYEFVWSWRSHAWYATENIEGATVAQVEALLPTLMFIKVDDKRPVFIGVTSNSAAKATFEAVDLLNKASEVKDSIAGIDITAADVERFGNVMEVVGGASSASLGATMLLSRGPVGPVLSVTAQRWVGGGLVLRGLDRIQAGVVGLLRQSPALTITHLLAYGISRAIIGLDPKDATRIANTGELGLSVLEIAAGFLATPFPPSTVTLRPSILGGGIIRAGGSGVRVAGWPRAIILTTKAVEKLQKLDSLPLRALGIAFTAKKVELLSFTVTGSDDSGDAAAGGESAGQGPPPANGRELTVGELIGAAKQARKKVEAGGLKDFVPPPESRRRPGHSRSGHGFQNVNDPIILDIRNNPEKIYVGVNDDKSKVIVFFKDSTVVITDAGDASSVITAFGKNAPGKAGQPAPKPRSDIWANDPYYYLVK